MTPKRNCRRPTDILSLFISTKSKRFYFITLSVATRAINQSEQGWEKTLTLPKELFEFFENT